jgi:hypothetical protein
MDEKKNDWIHLAQENDKQRAPVNTVISLRVAFPE